MHILVFWLKFIDHFPRHSENGPREWHRYPTFFIWKLYSQLYSMAHQYPSNRIITELVSQLQQMTWWFSEVGKLIINSSALTSVHQQTRTNKTLRQLALAIAEDKKKKKSAIKYMPKMPLKDLCKFLGQSWFSYTWPSCREQKKPSQAKCSCVQHVQGLIAHLLD